MRSASIPSLSFRCLPPSIEIGIQKLPLAGAEVIVGLSAVFKRDSESVSRLQRAFALGGLSGTGICLFGTVLMTTAGPDDIGRELTGILVWALAALLIVCGLIGWGAGYLRSESVRLGAALTGAPLLTVAYFGLSLAGIDFSSVGELLLITPTGVMALVVGYDLWVVSNVSDHV